jgi:hypothetical protein
MHESSPHYRYGWFVPNKLQREMEQGGVYPIEKKRKWGSAHSVSHAQVHGADAFMALCLMRGI